MFHAPKIGRNTLPVTLTSRRWIEQIFFYLILLFLLYKVTIESTYAHVCLVAAPFPPSVCVCVLFIHIFASIYINIYVSIHA